MSQDPDLTSRMLEAVHTDLRLVSELLRENSSAVDYKRSSKYRATRKSLEGVEASSTVYMPVVRTGFFEDPSGTSYLSQL